MNNLPTEIQLKLAINVFIYCFLDKNPQRLDVGESLIKPYI